MYVACVVAAALVTDAWPTVEIVGPQVSVRLAGQGERGVRERATWREVTGWARKLGGRELDPGEGSVR